MSPHQQHLSTFRFVKWETVMVLLRRWLIYAFWSVDNVNFFYKIFTVNLIKLGCNTSYIWLSHIQVQNFITCWWNASLVLKQSSLHHEHVSVGAGHAGHSSLGCHCVVTLWYLHTPWPVSLVCLLHSATTSSISLGKYKGLTPGIFCSSSAFHTHFPFCCMHVYCSNLENFRRHVLSLQT